MATVLEVLGECQLRRPVSGNDYNNYHEWRVLTGAGNSRYPLLAYCVWCLAARGPAATLDEWLAIAPWAEADEGQRVAQEPYRGWKARLAALKVRLDALRGRLAGRTDEEQVVTQERDRERSEAVRVAQAEYDAVRAKLGMGTPDAPLTDEQQTEKREAKAKLDEALATLRRYS